jgi:fused signal recognition particle receptor
MGLVKYSTSSSSKTKMERLCAFLQNLLVFALLLSTFFPYVQYHEFLKQKQTMESSQEQLERTNFKLERNLREMTTKATHREQDARQAETKISKVEKEMKEKERRNQALEISQQTLQKKLDGCVKDRTSLSEEVTTSTTKVNEVARIESKLERCKHDNLDLNAMTKELRTELTALEKELKQEVKLRKQAEKASAAQREMATKIKNSLLAMQQAEDKAEKEKARAQVLKRLAKAEKLANATKRKNEEGEDEEDEEDEEVDEDEEDEELGTPKAKRKSRKKDEEDEEEYDDLAHRKIVADEDEDIQPGSRAHEAEKRLRFEKKKSMKKERWSAGGLDKDLNGRLNVDRLRKTPKLTRAEGIQGSLSSHNGGGSSSAAELARARAMRDET